MQVVVAMELHRVIKAVLMEYLVATLTVMVDLVEVLEAAMDLETVLVMDPEVDLVAVAGFLLI
jgi:hypothetical protein